ncbi:MAG: hypothetical protein KDD99_02870 [Bacteroidetes bacterium]|nr:hypothetical protein [Bacteroidota bacterium]
MKKPFMTKIHFIITILFSVSLVSCCPPCEPEDLGDFLLLEDTGKWFEFTDDADRTFINDLNQEDILSYSPIESGFEDLGTNCTEENNCGICCDMFGGGYAYTELTSANLSVSFHITFKKDFRQFVPTDDPFTITDYLTITFNNSLSCELSGLPEVNLTKSVILNGTTFTQVFSCERDAGINLGPSDPRAFYFTEQEGIVGFEMGNGTVWSLKK